MKKYWVLWKAKTGKYHVVSDDNNSDFRVYKTRLAAIRCCLRLNALNK